MADPMVKGFLAELAANDGIAVFVSRTGRVMGRSQCPHIAPTSREITSTLDIDALVQATAFCPVLDCEARQNARAVISEMAAVRAAR
ncbi:MAG: hypothetical protein AB7P40_00175 [Chloroflexota bacterium]